MSDIPVIYFGTIHHALWWKHYKKQTTFFFWHSGWRVATIILKLCCKKEIPFGQTEAPPTFLWCCFWIREIPNFFVFFLGNCKKLAKCHDSPELFGECLYSESSFLPLLHTNLHSPHNARASQEFSGRLSLHVVARTALLSGDPLPLLSARHLWQYVPWQNIKFSRDL